MKNKKHKCPRCDGEGRIATNDYDYDAYKFRCETCTLCKGSGTYKPPKLTIKVKRLYTDAKLPVQPIHGDAGWDLFVHSINETPKYIEYKTGIAIEIPPGYGGFLLPRSSVSNKNLSLRNSVGLLDPSYRGEITFRYGSYLQSPDVEFEEPYKVGERCGQLVVLKVPALTIMEVEELSSTVRGKGGYGSTGR